MALTRSVSFTMKVTMLDGGNLLLQVLCPRQFKIRLGALKIRFCAYAILNRTHRSEILTIAIHYPTLAPSCTHPTPSLSPKLGHLTAKSLSTCLPKPPHTQCGTFLNIPPKQLLFPRKMVCRQGLEPRPSSGAWGPLLKLLGSCQLSLNPQVR